MIPEIWEFSRKSCSIYYGHWWDHMVAIYHKFWMAPMEWLPSWPKVGPSQRSIAAFKDKIDMMARAHKGKKAATKEKQKTTRIAQQQSWNHSIKRVQRYLGIREAGREKQMGAIRTSLENSGLIWKDYDASVQAAAAKLESTTKFDLDISPPYEQERSVVFICVDVSHSWNKGNLYILIRFRLKLTSVMLARLLRLVLLLSIQRIFKIQHQENAESTGWVQFVLVISELMNTNMYITLILYMAVQTDLSLGKW